MKAAPLCKNLQGPEDYVTVIATANRGLSPKSRITAMADGGLSPKAKGTAEKAGGSFLGGVTRR